MKLKICLGSAARLKGSSKVVGDLRDLIVFSGLSDKVTLSGTFEEAAVDGVAVWVNDEVFSVTPESVQEFFKINILDKMGK